MKLKKNLKINFTINATICKYYLSSLFVPEGFIIGISFNDIETSCQARHYDFIFDDFDP